MNGEWPQDTAMVTYPNMLSLIKIVQILDMTGHTFIVSPKTSQVAMSEEAASLIIGWEGHV